MNKDDLKVEENEHGQKQENYMALGMCFGVMAGSVAMAILAMFGQIAWGGMCIGLGLILGMLIGRHGVKFCVSVFRQSHALPVGRAFLYIWGINDIKRVEISTTKSL